MEVGDVFYSRGTIVYRMMQKEYPKLKARPELEMLTYEWRPAMSKLTTMQVKWIVRKLKTTTDANTVTNGSGEANPIITKDSHLLQPPKGGQDGHAE